MDTDLAVAVKAGDTEAVKALVHRGHNLLCKDETGVTLLHLAARYGRIDVFRDLSQLGLNPLTVTNKDETVLHYACYSKEPDVVSFIFHNYPTLRNKRTKEGFTVLHYAASVGNLKALKILVEEGADVYSSTEIRYTILHEAALSGTLNVVKFIILNLPALKYQRDRNGWTALHYVAKGGSEEVLKYIVDQGLNITAQTPNGRTVLHIACYHNNQGLVRYLLSRYPKLKNIVDESGHTALHSAAAGGDVSLFVLAARFMDTDYVSKGGINVLQIACKYGKLEMVKYLSTEYSQLKLAVDDNGRTLLNYAAEGGNVDIFRHLISQGLKVRVDDLNENDESVLHSACQYGEYNMAKYLISKYPQLKNKYTNGRPELHYVAGIGEIEFFQFLVTLGLDVDITGPNSETVLHSACLSGQYEMAYYLASKYPSLLEKVDNDKWTCLHYAAASGNVHLVQFLLGQGLSEVSLGSGGVTILHIACQYGNYSVVKYLTSAHERLNNKLDSNTRSAIHYAAAGGNVDVFVHLRNKGLVTLTADASGVTVLHLSCQAGKYEMVKYLLSTFPGLLTERDKHNRTSLHFSAESGDVRIFKLLVNSGLDPSSLSNSGYSVLHDACIHGHYNTVSYIVTTYPYLLGEETREGKTALQLSAESGNTEITSYLIDNTPLGNIQESMSTDVTSTGKDFLMKILIDKYAALTKSQKRKQPKQRQHKSLLVDTWFEADSGAPSSYQSDGRRSPSVISDLDASSDRSSDPMDVLSSDEDELHPDTKWPKNITFLSPSLVIQHIQREGNSSTEIKRLLKWMCTRAQKYVEQAVHVWPGYFREKKCEPVFVAIVNEEPSEDAPSTFESFELVTRKEGTVSNEAQDIAEMEMKHQLQFSSTEQEKLRECLRIHSVSLMNKHSNIQVISASKLKSRKYGTPDATTDKITCIVFYVHIKGVIPFHEEPFPEEIDGFPVDVREGLFYPHSDTPEYHEKLVMGCQISSAYHTIGTLGGFVELGGGGIGCLTCWHVFLSEDSKRDLRQTGGRLPNEQFKCDVYQPDCSGENRLIGKVIKQVHNAGSEETIGVDAALVEITNPERLPVNGNFPNATNASTGFSKDRPMEFNSGKIFTNFRDVPTSRNVVKYGHTTKHTIGMLRLQGPAAHKRKFAYSTSTGDKYELFQQFEILPIEGRVFSDRGDSGSMVFMQTCEGPDYDIRALGLIVGGTSYSSTIVTPIWAVLDQLGLPQNLMHFETDLLTNSTSTQTVHEMEQLAVDVSTLQSDVSSLQHDMSAVKFDVEEVKTSVTLLQETTKTVGKTVEDLKSRLDQSTKTMERKIDENTKTVQTKLDENTKTMEENTKTMEDVKSLIQQLLVQVGISTNAEPRKENGS